MWTVDQKYFALLLGGGGRPFTAFVDDLIRAHGFACGVSGSEILTSLRTNIADGGVDTEVRTGIADDFFGFLLQPTCWQYKAQQYSAIKDGDLVEEIEKRYARELIEKGYAYRFAICDDMPAEKQAGWEQLLTTKAREMNPNAPEARVVTASQLAAWANNYPALLPAHFPFEIGPVLYFEAWSRNITRVTPTFVPLEAWTGTAALIGSHIDLSQPVIRATLALQGMAGVGKTRLVHEVIASVPGAHQVVLYANDGDDAENVARSLANDGKTRCILIADECSVTARVNIGKVLKGHRERVRVVCIDNSGERPVGGEEELRLEVLASGSVEEVLEKNFPLVPPDRRRTYAELSGGYIRFAADLCEHHAEIESKGHLGPALASVHEYYLDRLPDEDQRRAVEAIALVQKIGFGEGVAEELRALCELTRQEPEQVLESAAKLKDAPGFIVRTTRYLYITPEVVARIAFASAWRRWVEGDPDGFLRRLPPILLESFQARVGRSASLEVRALTGKFFWDSVATLKPSDLADEKVAERLATLINTNPDVYFPRLELLVREASLDELRESKGGLGRSGSRRTLVWTAEHLAGFPQYFWQSERILRRLALAETEERIGNNATGVWKELFRIQLSGAATPFAERMELLGRILFSSDAAERDLAFEALKETLNLTGGRVVGPSVVAGQLVPPDWQPRDFEELQGCLDLVISLFDRVLSEGTPDMRQKMWPTFAQHLRTLLSHRMLPSLQAVVGKHPIPEENLPAIFESLEDFLQYECREEAGGDDDPYCVDAAKWLQALTPSDFLGRLKAVLGKDPSHHSIREDISGIPSEIVPLAEELVRDPEAFYAALPFLNSRDAASAGLLGDAMARIDPEAKYMDAILSRAIGAPSYTLARGYVGRLIALYPACCSRLDTWLTRLEDESPELAYWLTLSARECSDPLERTLRLIRAGTIPVQSLQNFVVTFFLDQMTSWQFTTVLNLLIAAGDGRSLHIAMDFVGHSVQKGRKVDADERAAVWRVLEASAPVDDRADYWWVRALRSFADETPNKACRVAIMGLTGEDYDKRNKAWGVLSLVAKNQPDLVMDSIGEVLLDKERGWRLRIGARSALFQTLPLDVVQRWLAKTDIEGARAIANHLQPPSVSKDGVAQIHPLTEYVLATWGDDEVVFDRFAASTHNLQMYTGDIAATHLKEAENARPLLSHPISAIRRWAENEVAMGEEQARRWRIRNEEQFLG